MQKAHGRSQVLIHAGNESSPQGSDRTGASNHDLLAIDLYLIAGGGTRVTRHVGHPTSDMFTCIDRGRYAGGRLIGRQGKRFAHPTSGCAATGAIVPYNFTGNRPIVGFKTGAATR